MKIASREIDAFLAKMPAAIKAVLLFGENASLARDYADALTTRVVPNGKDNERILEIAASDLRKDPARLSDEASQLSMFSPGRRVIRIRDASEGMGELFSTFLKESAWDALVIVEASELSAKASLRTAFEQAPNAAAIACYDDTPETLLRLAADELKKHAIVCEEGALESVLARVGIDRRVIRNELQKIALYFAQSPAIANTLNKKMVDELLGQSGDVEASNVCVAAAMGDHQLLDRLLVQAEDSGAAPAALVSATLRHFHALMAARSHGQTDDAVNVARSRGLWGHSDASIRAQLRLWSIDRLAAAVRVLGQAEASTRTTTWPEWPVASRALLHAARLAG